MKTKNLRHSPINKRSDISVEKKFGDIFISFEPFIDVKIFFLKGFFQTIKKCWPNPLNFFLDVRLLILYLKPKFH